MDLNHLEERITVPIQLEHITDLYVIVDELLRDQKKIGLKLGRKTILSDSEMITILVWNVLTMKQKTIKDLYTFLRLHLGNEFPEIPKYGGFVAHCNRLIPELFSILSKLLMDKTVIRFLDSTFVEVCKNHRADRYRVAKEIVAWGKNHQGWHFGFKLHAAIDAKGRLCALVVTKGDVYDAQRIPKLVNRYTKVIVGDSHYGATAMYEYIYEKYGILIIAPPHYKQKTKIMAMWQQLLLNMRSKIESMFDYLKEHLHLVTSFPRSAPGYLAHYLRVLIGYQIISLNSERIHF